MFWYLKIVFNNTNWKIEEGVGTLGLPINKRSPKPCNSYTVKK